MPSQDPGTITTERLETKEARTPENSSSEVELLEAHG
jgi:hypothetical protein